MGLEAYRSDLDMCCRCSACKFIPFERVKSKDSCVCPSIAKYNFHAYSGGGRLAIATAMLEKRIEYSDKLMEITYNCQMCGACDISCKYAMDMEVIEPIYEFRIKAVEEGHTNTALDGVINSLRNQGTMVPGAKAKRGDWAEGLGLKDFTQQNTKIVYHVGCQTSFNKDMWKVAKATIELLKKAEIDFGIGGENESCCGGRAYQMGYKKDFLKQAKRNMEQFQKAGIETLVTGCADGYHAFKVLYDKFGLKGNLEVLHITEYLDRLIKDNKLKPTKKVDMVVTYHDPCHLGRLGEPWIHWEGKQVPGHIRIFEPPKEFRRGTNGVYEPPRDILKNIPGIKLVEMDKIKEYAWCCGAGGGVKESNPEFALWTARKRIEEAEATGAEALATACPICEKNFKDTIIEIGSSIKVYDVVEILKEAF